MVPSRALLDQFALDFPGFCKVGTYHNQKINFNAKGFIAVSKSVPYLKNLTFNSIFVDEAHHPLPAEMPKGKQVYQLSATHAGGAKDEPDFRYSLGQAIDDGVLCDYDITVPAVTVHHAYVGLGDLLRRQAGRFRRVLAYCNTVREAKRFQMVLEKLGLAAWHINGNTPLKKRQAVMEEFAGDLQKPVHVLVTVEILGEGINIPNADTCMFVEPRQSYRSIIQAIGRVLRHHPNKTLAHIILPAVAVPQSTTAPQVRATETLGYEVEVQPMLPQPEESEIGKQVKQLSDSSINNVGDTKCQQQRIELERDEKRQGKMRSQKQKFSGKYQAVGSKEERAQANGMFFANNNDINDASESLEGSVGMFGNGVGNANLQQLPQPIGQLHLEKGRGSSSQQFPGSYQVLGSKCLKEQTNGMCYEDRDDASGTADGVGVVGVQLAEHEMEQGQTRQKQFLPTPDGLKFVGINKKSSHAEAVTVLATDVHGRFLVERGQHNLPHHPKSSKTFQANLPTNGKSKPWGHEARQAEVVLEDSLSGVRLMSSKQQGSNTDLAQPGNSFSKHLKEPVKSIPLESMGSRSSVALAAEKGSPDGQTELLKDPRLLQEHVAQIEKPVEFVELQKSKVRIPAFSFKPKMRRVKLESSNILSDFSAFALEHSNQLERFLEVLVQADQRLVGSAVGHRIQIVDCTVGGEFEVDPLMEAVYGRLSAILAQRDPWETRLDEVEAFVEKHGRCPRKRGANFSLAERVLGNWVDHQREAIRSQRMPAHRLQMLLNTSSSLLRRRSEGWLAGGLEGAFEQNCQELKQYIETHGELPKLNLADCGSLGHRLARWLIDLRNTGAFAIPERKKMLEQVHLLVKELVQQWSSTTFKNIDENEWKKQLKRVVDFHQWKGWLPRGGSKKGSESSLYRWLRLQRKRLAAGILPAKLTAQLMAATKIWEEKVSVNQ